MRPAQGSGRLSVRLEIATRRRQSVDERGVAEHAVSHADATS